MVEVVRSESVIKKSRRVPKEKANNPAISGSDARDESKPLSEMNAIGDSTTADTSTRTLGAAEGKLGALRRRQRSIGAILENLFGNPDRWKPNVWGRRAYWLIAGLIYERLAITENEIETDELIGLAKILAENRKLELLERESRGPKRRRHTRAQGDIVSGKLARAIRDVYGMEVDKSEKGA